MYAEDITLYCNLNPGTPNFVNIINGELGKVSNGFQQTDCLSMLTKLRLCFFIPLEKL